MNRQKQEERKLVEAYTPKESPCPVVPKICGQCGETYIIIEIPAMGDRGIVVDYQRTFEWKMETAGWQKYRSSIFSKNWRCPICVKINCQKVIQGG